MWRFKELSDTEPEHNPHEAEFFQDLDVADALVRENIQNSLDARNSYSSPVVVRYTFGEQNCIDNIYFDDLLPHIKSAGIISSATLPPKIHYLVLEDFNTKGLDGPLSRDETDGLKGNYLNFWWGEGESDKGGKNAGRWGLGKTVYHKASVLRTFFGLTVRANDNQELLLGKALLKAHKHIDNKRYNYFGYYTASDGKPITDPKSLSDFKNTFTITRTNEPGLSVVIPMIVSGVTPQNIIRSSIIHYFFPIITNDLVIKVNDQAETTTINRQTICDIARQQSWENTDWENRNIDSLIAFLERVASNQNMEKTALILPSGIPKMTQELFGNNLESLRQAYQESKLLLLTIPVLIAIKGSTRKSSYFEVYVQRDESLKEPDEFYIRAGITITEIRMLHNRRVRTLLSARDDIISTFLGDSESPAHTKWEERNEDFIKKYENARDTLRFIRSSIREIIKILDYAPPGIDPEFLKGIFSLSKGKTEKPIIPAPTEPPTFNIERVKAGFRLSLVDKKIVLPITKLVKIAYDTQKGNPFSKYNPLDFDLSQRQLIILARGSKIINASQNRIQIEVAKPDFALRIEGFDENRDIVISVQ